MSHLDDGILHALLDGEIASSELGGIQTHLAACPQCRARLEAERDLAGEASTLVDWLEVPAAEAPRPRGARTGTPRRRNLTRNLAWAASVTAAIGLGYAARGTLRVIEIAPPERASGQAPGAGLVTASEQTSPIRAGGGRGSPAPAPTAAPAPTPAVSQAPAAGVAGRNLVTTAPPAPLAESVTDTGALTRKAVQPAAAPQVAADRPEEFRARERLDAAAPRAADATGAFAAAKMAPASPADVVTFSEAVRRLNGSLRLIPGLVPSRLEAQGSTVRVIYPSLQGDLVLAQRLIGGKVIFTLNGPPGFPSDSLERLRKLVRE